MSFFAGAKNTSFHGVTQMNAGNAVGHIKYSSAPQLGRLDLLTPAATPTSPSSLPEVSRAPAPVRAPTIPSSPTTTPPSDAVGFFPNASGTRFFGPVQMNDGNARGYIDDTGAASPTDAEPLSPISPTAGDFNPALSSTIPSNSQSLPNAIAPIPTSEATNHQPKKDSRTIDDAIAVAESFIKSLSGAGQLAGIAAIGPAASIALAILKGVKDAKGNKSAFRGIGLQCWDILEIVKHRVEGARTLDATLRADANSLMDTLTIIDKDVKKYLKRSSLRRFLFSSVDADIVQQCRNQLAFALARFQLQTSIELRNNMQTLLQIQRDAQQGSGSKQKRAQRGLERAARRQEQAAKERERAAQAQELRAQEQERAAW